MRLLVQRGSGSGLWRWEHPGEAAALRTAVRRLVPYFRELRTAVPTLPGDGKVEAIIDASMSTCMQEQEAADALLQVDAAQVYFVPRTSLALLALCEGVMPARNLARGCLPLVEEALPSHTKAYPLDGRLPEALALVRASLADASATAGLTRALDLAERTSADAYDDYAGLEMAAGYWTVAAADCVAHLVRVHLGEPGAATKLAEAAAKACEPADARQNERQRAHLALLAEPAAWLAARDEAQDGPGTAA